MSNQYIDVICTMPQDVAFGFSAEHSKGGLPSLSIAQRLKIEAGLIRPQTTTGIRHIYAREAARWLGDKIKNKTDKPMTGLVSQAFNFQKGAWEQFSLPPTSNKSVWFQGSIALSALAAYTGKKDLAKKAKDLYSSGVNTPLKTDIGSIQSAAKNVYRKAAKAAEKAGLSSSQSQVKFVLNHLRNYAKVSEIVFGKNLSIQSSSDVNLSTAYSKTAQRLSENKKRAAAKEEANKVKKARGLDVKASVDIPFKNKIEGNVFRSWVNDNHRKWAKKNDLSRSGAFNNSYIKKAWKRWGQDYREAMAQKLFMERKNDDLIVEKPIPVAAPIPVDPKPLAISAPLPFDDASDPFEDEDPEIGMMELLEDDPEEFLKKYWYIPTGGFVGIIALSLGVRALLK